MLGAAMMQSMLRSSNVLAIAVLAVVVMLVVPVPTPLLDALLALDVMAAAAVLVVTLSIRDPLEVTAFPTFLLVATLFRLSLDVSATRLILTQGDQPGGVGTVIPAFGEFVMRGNFVVGLLLFAILIIVQLVVVANGAQRVAEVAARFTLDAMPGKQMAIDADLHAGLIDAAGAQARRRAVQAEADFYGAMDGAGKFVRGDAIAALIILAVNVVAGIGIGMIGKHLDPVTAVQTYALLSVGNALATTLPAFLLSTAMGVVVTRAASDEGLGSDIARQLLGNPTPLRTVGAAMLGLALVPGLPHLAFGALGALGFAGGQAAARASERRRKMDVMLQAQRRRAEARKPESAVHYLGVDQLTIDVGEALLSLLDEPAGSALLQRIAALRRVVALELGIVLPGVHVRDDLRLPPRGFAIRVRDRVAAQAQLHPDRAFALGQPAAISALPGDAAIDPVTAQDGRWVPAGASPAATSTMAEEAPTGVVVVDPIAVIASSLGAVAREHAAALLGRQEVQMLLDHVRQSHPAVVKGVVPELAGLGLVQRVLQHLLREGVSIRDLVAILETIADEVETTKDAAQIGEAARRRLAPVICASLAREGGVIRAAVVSPDTDAALSASVAATERGPALALGPSAAQALAAELRALSRDGVGRATLVCSQTLRLPLARFAELCANRTVVLGLAEIAPGYTVEAEKIVTFNVDAGGTEPEASGMGPPASKSNLLSLHSDMREQDARTS